MTILDFKLMGERKAKLNILVTDDHTLFRKGMMMLLESFNEVGAVDDAENGKEALKKLRDGSFDLVLMDLEMPILDGRETAKKIVSKFPEVSIVMISMHDSLQLISDLIEIGVHSYLLKNADPEEVRKAITSVLNNEFYYNQLVSRALHKNVQKNVMEKPGTIKPADVSPREVEVLELICQELTMREIGEKLFLSEQTVHTHRKNLMKKTQARNAVGLVKFALQNGIARI